MVALIADRWLQGRIDDEQAQAYKAYLGADLRGDSAALSARIVQARDRANTAILLLELAEGLEIPGTTSVPELVAAFEMLTWFSPLDANRDTWDDLVATGNSRLIDRDLRRMLVAHYNRLEGLAAAETDWDNLLAAFETDWRDTQPALRRLEALELAIPIGTMGDRLERKEVGRADLDLIVRRIREDRALNTGLGHSRAIWLGAAVQYDFQLQATTALLADLE